MTSLSVQNRPSLEVAISKMVDWIAPITVYPGEDELLALAQGALRVLKGEEKAQEYRRPRPEDNN